MQTRPMMRAALCERFGDASAIRVAEVLKPVPGEALVRIHTSTLDSADRRGRMVIPVLSTG